MLLNCLNYEILTRCHKIPHVTRLHNVMSLRYPWDITMWGGRKEGQIGMSGAARKRYRYLRSKGLTSVEAREKAKEPMPSNKRPSIDSGTQADTTPTSYPAWRAYKAKQEIAKEAGKGDKG